MEGDNSPSVSSQVDEIEEKSHTPDAPDAPDAPDSHAHEEKPQVDVQPVEDLRRISIHSEDGQDSIVLASYTYTDGSKRFMLNNIDIPLTDFRGYLRSLTETESNRHDELLFVGIQASFMTGLMVLLVAFGLTLIKSELPCLLSQ